MLNYLWGFMILAGILWSAFHGTLGAVTGGALEAAREAVTLCITMLGVMSFWTGILEVGRRAGLIEQLSRRLKPLLRFLFPRIPQGHPALESISANMIANMLGLGWAATPAGLQAMKELEELEEERREKSRKGERGKAAFLGDGSPVPPGAANDEMCTFLVFNISSLQLIPVNMIAYRAQYGSVNPLAVVGPALAATTISTVAAILFCRIMNGKKGKGRIN